MTYNTIFMFRKDHGHGNIALHYLPYNQREVIKSIENKIEVFKQDLKTEKRDYEKKVLKDLIAYLETHIEWFWNDIEKEWERKNPDYALMTLYPSEG